MPLPNTTGAQAAGVNPNTIQKKNDLEQSINNTMREIQLKLDNVMNVRGNMQAGVYGAFGNNFLSRGMMEVGDSISDAIASIFAEPEQEKEDPVTKALKEQTEVLGKKIDKGSKASNDVEEQIILLRRDIKQTRELERADIVEQDEILETILHALTGTTQTQGPTPSPTQQEFDFGGMYQQDTTINSAGQTTPVDIVEQADDDNDKPKNREEHVPTLLKRILQTLFGVNKNLDRLVKAQPMSTREAEIEALRTKNEQLAKSREAQDIQTTDEGGKRGFDWTRIFSGLLDFDANLRGMKNVFGFVIDGMKLAFNGLLSVLTPVTAGIVKLATTIASVISSIATSVLPALGAIAKTAMKFAVPAAVMLGVGAGVDALAGTMGVGGKEIDAAKDEENWNKMTLLQKAESGLARGIEKTGEFLFMDNMANEAKSRRIKAESEYLEKTEANKTAQVDIGKVDAGNLTTIEATQKQIETAKRLKESSSGPSVTPLVQDNRVTNNQTIMPTRTVIENPETAYRRYMENILVPR